MDASASRIRIMPVDSVSKDARLPSRRGMLRSHISLETGHGVCRSPGLFSFTALTENEERLVRCLRP